MDHHDHGWTLVVGRKAFKLQPSLVHPHSQVPPPISLPAARKRTKSRSSLGFRSFACPNSPQDGGGQEEEKQILMRLNRSIDRLEQSEFYKKFLEQMRSPHVLDNIRRAAAPSAQVNDANMRSSASRSCEEKSVSAATGRWEGDVEENSEQDRRHSRHGKASEVEGQVDRVSDVSVDVQASRKISDEQTVENATGEDKYACNGTGETNWQLDIVAYGLGSIADSEVSRCQFSLVLLLKRACSWVGRIEVYDPVLSQLECNVIQALGCCLIAVNEEGKRIINRPTVFYMPHCEDWLYDNLLSVNWSRQKLSNLIVLGNSFTCYQERWSSLHAVQSKPPPTFLLRFQKYAREIPIEATSSLHLPVFNNISWHFFILEAVADTDLF